MQTPRSGVCVRPLQLLQATPCAAVLLLRISLSIQCGPKCLTRCAESYQRRVPKLHVDLEGNVIAGSSEAAAKNSRGEELQESRTMIWVYTRLMDGSHGSIAAVLTSSRTRDDRLATLAWSKLLKPYLTAHDPARTTSCTISASSVR